MRVPIRIIKDDDISCGQVNTQPTSPGAQHEDKLGAVGVVVGIDGDLSVQKGGFKLGFFYNKHKTHLVISASPGYRLTFHIIRSASHLPLLMWRLAIEATILVVPPHAVVLQDVQHPGHLTEDEYT